VPRPKSVRRYVKPCFRRDEFFDILSRRGVRYVILRWFDDLPEWPDHEDMDLLVHDEDLARISDLFTYYTQGMPCDIYSVTAINDWNGIPYYPPSFAIQLLDEKVTWQERYCIPSEKNLLMSLAYHVVFHKAEQSGFALSGSQVISTDPDVQRYFDVFNRLSEVLGIDFELSLSGLYELLEDHGGIPPLGTFRKLALRSEWLKRVLVQRDRQPAQKGELIVYTLREWALKNGLVEFITRALVDKVDSYEILEVKTLNRQQKDLASEKIRGGTWGYGHYPVNGGTPAMFVVVFDYAPAVMPESHKEEFPFIKNGHFMVKAEIRNEINSHYPKSQWVNCIHSSDDEIEAWEDLRSIGCSTLVQTVQNKLLSLRQEASLPYAHESHEIQTHTASTP